MANRNYYPNLPGVRAIYNDGQLSQTTENTAGRALFLGAAKQGPSFRKLSISNFDNALAAFKDSELMDQVLSSVRVGNESIRVERVGGRQTHHSIKTELSSGSHEMQTLIRVSLVERLAADSDELGRYYLALLPYKDGNIYRQRVLGIYYGARASSGSIVYDSEMILAQDAGLFEIEINVPNGSDNLLHTHAVFGTGAAPANGAAAYDTVVTPKLSLSYKAFLIQLGTAFETPAAGIITKLDGTDVGFGAAAYSYEILDGKSGETLDHCERYANLEMAYEELEYTDTEFLVPEGCYADVLPVNLADISIDTAKQYADYHLGYFWKYVYRGRPYMFMFGRKNPFDAGDIEQAGFVQAQGAFNVQFDISADQAKLGDLLNLVEVHFHHDAAQGATELEIYPNELGRIEAHISYAQPAAPEVVVTPFATITLPVGMNESGSMRMRPSLSLCEPTVANTADRNLSEALLSGEYNSDPFVLTHYDLTGELVPEEVLGRLFSYNDGNYADDATLVAASVEIREVNLAHQAAQAAYKASASYSQTIAFAQLSKPSASRNGVSEWAGEPPTYEVDNAGDIVVVKSGTGIMANKLMFGAPGYRSNNAYGGFICTKGDSLPNELPYGIDDTDEAVDQFGNPIDIGKHLVIVGAYALAQSSAAFKQSQTKLKAPRPTAVVKNVASEIASILATLPVDQEPIGPVNGVIPGVSPIGQRIPKSVLNNLALGRVVMLDETGAISAMRTAAVPNSDFTRISTIRAANTILSEIRRLALPLLGSNYRNAKDTLNTQILGRMRAFGQAGVIQPGTGVAQIIQSRADEISGRMRILVSFTPPFALEQITVDLTLTPPA